MRKDIVKELHSKCSSVVVKNNGRAFALIDNSEVYFIDGDVHQKVVDVTGVHHSLVYSENIGVLVAASVDGVLWVYLEDTQKYTIVDLSENGNLWTRSVKIVDSRRKVLFVGYDESTGRSTVCLVDIDNTNYWEFVVPLEGTLNTVALDVSPDAKLLIESCNRGRDVVIRDFTNFAQKHILGIGAIHPDGTAKDVWAPVVRFSDDGKCVFVGTQQGFFIWELSDKFLSELCASVTSLRVVDARIVGENVYTLLVESNVMGVSCWYAVHSITGVMKDRSVLATVPTGATTKTFSARLSDDGKKAAVVLDSVLNIFEF